MASKYKKYLTALGVATGLILTTTPAHAGFVAPIIAAVGAALGIGAVAATVVVVVAAVVAVAAVGYAVQSMTPSFDVPDYSSNTADGAAAVNTGILVNKTGTNNPIPVVYGYRKIGGTRVFVSTDGSSNEYLYIAMVFAEGEINAFKQLIFDDKLVANGTLTTQIDNSAYSAGGRLRYELQRGTAGQTSPSWFHQNGWGSNHKLSGLAVGYFKLRWIRPDTDATSEQAQKTADDNPFGGIPKIQVVIQGKKTPVATSYVDGASTAYASMTKVYSTNPADHMLDYLMNPLFGRGLENDRVGFTSFKVAAQKFDTTVNYKTGGTGKILEFNYVVPTNRTMLENAQTMLQNMRSGMPYIQGKFNLKLLDTGHASNPTSQTPVIAFPVTEKEMIGGLTIEGLGHRDHYNQVKAVYPNPDTNWELDEVVYPKVNSATDEAFLAEDNNRRLVKEISLEAITNGNIAGDIASIVLLRSRKKKAISFVATAELHNTVVGDIITITYPSLGMSAAQFRITAHQITADYTVQITALEHNPTDYEFANTDVFMPKPVQISSDDQYANGGNVTSGNPYFPGAKTRDAIITGVTHLGGASYKLAITHATDITWVDKMQVLFISTGTNTPWVHPYIGNPFYPSGSAIPAIYIQGPTNIVDVDKANNELPTTIDVTIPPGAGAFLQFQIAYEGSGMRRHGPFKIIARQSAAYNLAIQKASGSTSYP